MTLNSSRRARTGLLLLILPVAVHCTAPAPAPKATPTASAGPPPVTAAPANQQTPGADGKPVLLNDPSAALDTPLCGSQAREVNAIGATLQGPRVATGGICTRFACYDPLTATYIGSDGYRHVCR